VANASATVPRFELRADNPRHIRALIALRDMYGPRTGFHAPADREPYRELGTRVREFDLYMEAEAARSGAAAHETGAPGAVPRFELRADNPRHIYALIALRDMYGSKTGAAFGAALPAAFPAPADRELYRELGTRVREFDLYMERRAASGATPAAGGRRG